MILAVVGPTAVGKTKLSEYLAEKYDAIVVNMDSVQIYKELNIGSAKPKKEELSDNPHFLFSIKHIWEDYTVCDFQKNVRNLLDEYKNKNIILVGGSGLYIQAALFDYEFDEESNEYKDYSELTNDELYELVLKKDEESLIHKNNRIRMERFLNTSGKKSKGNKLLYDVKFIGLKTDRETLYEKINNRVLEMFDEGLLDEVKSLIEYKDKSRVLNTAIGYKEVIKYIEGKTSKKQMIEEIQQSSRRYAKRQFTWFNNKINVNWFDVDYENFENTIDQIDLSLKEV